MEKKFYITTPIYYPSGNLHIGHSYCSVATDTIARFKRMQGHEVFFLTGTDEHGQKIAENAKAAGKSPKEFVDEIVANAKKLWKLMDVDYTRYIRTTDEDHVRAAQNIFQKLYDKGDIYKSEYEGLYCTPCESFWTESQLQEGKCPDCGRDVHPMREESYFFRLSGYQERLEAYIAAHPEFIQPVSRKNEMINNFIKPGLTDLAVSRTGVSWGIPVPFDPKHTIYVWVDALVNYITALGYTLEDDSLMKKFWPADLQLVGKEIVRFHTIIWPALLMALDLPLPKQVFGHGWMNLDGEKMSKSRGNVVDPVLLCNRYSSDAIRYFLMREMPFGQDGNFTNEALLLRMNTDLANDLGNLVSRTQAMVVKYFGGVLPKAGPALPEDAPLLDTARQLKARFEEKMDALEFSAALSEVWKLLGECNRYVDATAPWNLAKDEANRGRLGAVMYNLAESLRIAGICLAPIMPATPARIWQGLGIENRPDLTAYEAAATFGLLPAGLTVTKTDALFPRYDIEAELKELAALRPAPAKEKESKKAEEAPEKAEIGIEDFQKLSLICAHVVACEPVPDARKLLKLTVKTGEGKERTVVSGIAESYKPEELVGKQVVLVANLKPVRLRGILSEGMILCASDNGRLIIVSPEAAAAAGTVVS